MAKASLNNGPVAAAGGKESRRFPVSDRRELLKHAIRNERSKRMRGGLSTPPRTTRDWACAGPMAAQYLHRMMRRRVASYCGGGTQEREAFEAADREAVFAFYGAKCTKN